MPDINAWAPAELALGLAETSMGLVRTDHEFHAVRFLLGTAEAAFRPGMIVYIALWLTEIVTVTDARMERILRRAGWPLRRIGKPRPLGSTVAVAGYLEVSSRALARVQLPNQPNHRIRYSVVEFEVK